MKHSLIEILYKMKSVTEPNAEKLSLKHLWFNVWGLKDLIHLKYLPDERQWIQEKDHFYNVLIHYQSIYT